MSRPVILPDRIRLDAPVTGGTDAYGNPASGWEPKHTCRAEFIYRRGSETVEAARLSGRSIWKVRIRSCAAARTVTADWILTDTRRGTVYNIREADSLSDPSWVWLVVEAGVAT